MSNLNLNEIGRVIYVNVGSDISLSTPTLLLLPEYGEGKEITTGVTIGPTDITVDNEELFANEYIQYTTVDGDLDYAGRWKKKAKLDFSATDIQQTDFTKFRVLP
jgi:hypothetical protein